MKNRYVYVSWWTLFCVCLYASPLHAQLQLAKIFSDNMVLQREAPIVIWGTAQPGERLQVRLGTLKGEAKTDASGQWRVQLPALDAGGPHALVVQGKSNTIQYNNVLLGDVWICAGQSNMRWRVRDSYGGDLEPPLQTNPTLRLFDLEATLEPINKKYSLEVLQALQPDNYFKPAQWQPATQQPVQQFSAVGYFFGKVLQEKTGVPIGLIQTAVGGVPLETYLPKASMQADAVLAPLTQPGWLEHPLYPRWTAERVRQNLEAWLETTPAPTATMPNHPFAPAFLFEAAIHPLLPMPVKGVIWYQGESNATFTADSSTMDPKLNYHKLDLLVKSWRAAWNQPELPFYIVQLPAIQRDWEVYREVQLQFAQNTPQVGLAVTLDLGHATDVHPRDKQPVGQRLARLALANTYRLPLVAGGPLYKGYQVQADKLVIQFDQAGQGLASCDGLPLRGFLIAGEDRQFLPAQVVIKGNTLECSNPAIAKPVALRYAWADNPYDANLGNREGLPASPFRTDSWQ